MKHRLLILGTLGEFVQLVQKSREKGYYTIVCDAVSYTHLDVYKRQGTYRLSRSLRWQPLMGPSWGQYGTHVDGCGQGGIFIHSVAGSTKSVYNLPSWEYLKLGNPASHGCIRTCVADAKWVYENCNGATIHIYSSEMCIRDRLFGVELRSEADREYPLDIFLLMVFYSG